MWRWAWRKRICFCLPCTLRRSCGCQSELRRLQLGGSRAPCWGDALCSRGSPDGQTLLAHSDPHIERYHMWSLRPCSEDPSAGKRNPCSWDLMAMCVCTQEEHKRIQNGTLVRGENNTDGSAAARKKRKG